MGHADDFRPGGLVKIICDCGHVLDFGAPGDDRAEMLDVFHGGPASPPLRRHLESTYDPRISMRLRKPIIKEGQYCRLSCPKCGCVILSVDVLSELPR
jgi:hypothetical protein